MALSPLLIQRTTLESFRTTLQGAGAGRKDGQVSVNVARQFNLILERVQELVRRHDAQAPAGTDTPREAYSDLPSMEDCAAPEWPLD